VVKRKVITSKSIAFWKKGPKVVGALVRLSDLRKAIRLYEKKAVDALELRLDVFSNLELAELHKKISKLEILPPLLVTVRSKKEGGVYALTDNERKGRVRLFMPYLSAIDVELSSVHFLKWIKQEAKYYKKALIVSHHDFKKVPTLRKLETIFKKCQKYQPTLSKFAFQIKKQEELIPLISFLKRHKKQGIAVIGMGSAGVVSRILFPILGSKITFCHFGKASAPGQFPSSQLKKRISKLLRS